jgi:hypothetical protein
MPVFIGGPKDHELIETSLSHVFIPIPGGKARYKVMQFRGDKQYFNVMVLEGLTGSLPAASASVTRPGFRGKPVSPRYRPPPIDGLF